MWADLFAGHNKYMAMLENCITSSIPTVHMAAVLGYSTIVAGTQLIVMAHAGSGKKMLLVTKARQLA